jgi:hypothetical protein
MTSRKLDVKKIAEALGAEYMGTSKEVGGYLGAKHREQPCLIDTFFRNEAQKPMSIRKNYCHISCPCSKCNPSFM